MNTQTTITAAEATDGAKYLNQRGQEVTCRGRAGTPGYIVLENAAGVPMDVPASYVLMPVAKPDPEVMRLAGLDDIEAITAALPELTDDQLDDLAGHTTSMDTMKAIQRELASRDEPAPAPTKIKAKAEPAPEDSPALCPVCLHRVPTRVSELSDDGIRVYEVHGDGPCPGSGRTERDAQAIAEAGDDKAETAPQMDPRIHPDPRIGSGSAMVTPGGPDTEDNAEAATGPTPKANGYESMDRVARVAELHANVRRSREALKLETDPEVINEAIAAEHVGKRRETITKQLAARVTALGGTPWAPAGETAEAPAAQPSTVNLEELLAEANGDGDAERVARTYEEMARNNTGVPSAMERISRWLIAQGWVWNAATLTWGEPPACFEPIEEPAADLRLYNYPATDSDLVPGQPVVVARCAAGGLVEESYEGEIIDGSVGGHDRDYQPFYVEWREPAGLRRSIFAPRTGVRAADDTDGVHYRVIGFRDRETWVYSLAIRQVEDATDPVILDRLRDQVREQVAALPYAPVADVAHRAARNWRLNDHGRAEREAYRNRDPRRAGYEDATINASRSLSFRDDKAAQGLYSDGYEDGRRQLESDLAELEAQQDAGAAGDAQAPQHTPEASATSEETRQGSGGGGWPTRPTDQDDLDEIQAALVQLAEALPAARRQGITLTLTIST